MHHKHQPLPAQNISRVRLISRTAQIEALVGGHPPRAARLIAAEAAHLANIGMSASRSISAAMASGRFFMRIEHGRDGEECR